MSPCKRLMRASMVQARHFSQFNTIIPIAGALLNPKQPQLRGHATRFLLPTVVSPGRQLHHSNIRHVSTTSSPDEPFSPPGTTESAPPEPAPVSASSEPPTEAEYWMNARPNTLTRWEQVIQILYGPEYMDRLPTWDRELLDKVQKRRAIVVHKQKQVIGEQALQDAQKQRNAERARQNELATAAGENLMSCDPQAALLAEFIDNEAILAKAQAFMKMMWLMEKRDSGRASVVEMVKRNFERFDAKMLMKEKKSDFWKEKIANVHMHKRFRRDFVKRMKRKVLAIPKEERTTGRLEDVLRDVQLQFVGKYTNPVMEQQWEAFRARLEERSILYEESQGE